ncbi:MAG TPA: hypothetical protein ENF73_06170, partial [Proteobacteria bacterium]|nr:hypothetical protein [Pseudomonadota bacterium]
MFWGDLKTTLFSKVLLFLKRQGLGGTLYLRVGRVVKAIKIENGEPVAVKTTLAREGLIRYLWDKKRVAPKKLAELGRADDIFSEAISQGLIPESARVGVLRELYLMRLLDIFSWRSGDYFFWPSFLGGEWEVKAKAPISAAEVIVRGLLVRSSPSFLLSTIKPHLEQRFRFERTALYEANIALPQRYEALLGAFESGSTLGEVFKSESLPRKDLVKLAALLVSVDALKFEEPEPA